MTHGRTPAAQGLYDPRHEHDACGVGFVVDLKGRRSHAIVENAKALAGELMSRGYDLVSGGTDNHLILVDLTNKEVPGKKAAQALDKAGLVLNYNSIPFDPRKPFDPSGVRLGSNKLC